MESSPNISLPAPVSQEVHLTNREREIIDLIAVGFLTPGIARTLYISEHTVRSHVRNVMDKVGARTRAHLVALVVCGHLSSARGNG